MFPYLLNLLKLARNDRHLHPRVVIYYVTGQCNLNCAYCEDFGARRNDRNAPPLPLEQVMHILRVVRSGVDSLMLTGGEPLLHPEIDQIVVRAKKELKFRELTLISNGFLLPQHETALSAVDRLIVSLDSTDPEAWSRTIGVPAASAEAILANIRRYAALQSKFGYRMIVNAVITPPPDPPPFSSKMGGEGGGLLDFAIENRLLISFSPQSYNNWPRYELMVSPAYRAFIEKLIRLKRGGAPVFCSDAYLRTMLDLTPYDCYPTLAPRILPAGDLTYPCRPFEKADNGQGGRPVNLLQIQTWAEAWKTADKTYGQPPRSCHSCFQQCYVEPSLMQARPLDWLWEQLRYSNSRRGNLSTYAPG